MSPTLRVGDIILVDTTVAAAAVVGTVVMIVTQPWEGITLRGGPEEIRDLRSRRRPS